MKYKRLVVEDDSSSRHIDFHPRLTVVAGLDADDRGVLVRKLRDSLAPQPDGVHLELETTNGSYIAIYRGLDGEHRVIDILNTNDITNYFVNERDMVSAKFGLKMADDNLIVDAQDLANRVDEDRNLDALTAADQDELWEILDRISETEALATEAKRQHAELKPDTEDGVSAEVYDNYFTSAEPVSASSKFSALVAVGLTAGAAYCFTQDFFEIAAGLGVVGFFCLGFFGYPWIRQVFARRAADKALEEAGVDNFFDFNLQQVNGMLAQDQYAKALREASTKSEAALADWDEIVPGIDPDFARAHRTAIHTGAALRAQDPNDDPTTGFLHPSTPLILRAIGSVETEAEVVPRIFSAPFAGLDQKLRHDLLDALLAASVHRQIILVASEADVSSWAAQHVGADAAIVPGFITAPKPVAETAPENTISDEMISEAPVS